MYGRQTGTDQYPEILIEPGKMFIVMDRDEDVLEPTVIDVMVEIPDKPRQQVSLDDLVNAWLEQQGYTTPA